MTDRIDILIDDAGARRVFSRLAARSSDTSDLMRSIGDLLTESTRDRFKAGVAPDGSEWLPLADGSGRTPLTQTGRMSRDIAPSSGSDWLEIAAGAKQARWHQHGTAPYTIRPKGKRALAWAGGPGPRAKVEHPGLPARPFIGISRSDEAGIGRLVAVWLDL